MIISREKMDELRALAAEVEPETIAVIALAGSQASGLLGMSVSANEGVSEEEVFRLLAYLVFREPSVQAWITEVAP